MDQWTDTPSYRDARARLKIHLLKKGRISDEIKTRGSNGGEKYDKNAKMHVGFKCTSKRIELELVPISQVFKEIERSSYPEQLSSSIHFEVVCI